MSPMLLFVLTVFGFGLVGSSVPNLADILQTNPSLMNLADNIFDDGKYLDPELLRKSPIVSEMTELWSETLGIGSSEEAAVLTDNDKRKLREIFRFVNPRRSVVKRLLDEDTDLPPIFGELTVDGLVKRFKNDPKLFQDFLSTVQSPSSGNVKPLSVERDQCKVDYDQFVAPLTTGILISVLSSVCSQLLPPFICTIIIGSIPDNITMADGGLAMIDSMGKIPEGLREGRLAWVGAYDHCERRVVSYNVTNDGDVTPRTYGGRYCRVDLTPKSGLPVSLELGVCVPDTCTHEDVQWYIAEGNTLLMAVVGLVLNMSVTSVFCCTEEAGLDPDNDISLQAAVGIILASLILVVIATIYDGFFRKWLIQRKLMQRRPTELSKRRTEHILSSDKSRISFKQRAELFLVGFSALSNCRRIFTTATKPGHIPVLDGIRYLSWVFVIWGQTYVVGPLYNSSWTTANLVGSLIRLPKEFGLQPVLNFHLAGDSFLLISGILVSYWFLMKHKDKRLSVKSIVHHIVHKYWRLMVTFMLCIMFFACTYKYGANGPLFPSSDPDGENCKVNWWVDLLMVHNLVKVHEQCFGHAWFIPLVFQLHLAALVVLIPLTWPDPKSRTKKYKAGVYFLLAAMYIAHIITTAVISDNIRSNEGFGEWYNDYLMTPWCRAGPYLIGMAVGIIIFEKRKDKVKLHTVAHVLLSIGALIILGLCVYASYGQYKEDGELWTNTARTAYDTLARSAWALALGWIVLACHWDMGGVFQNLLQYRAFLPVSRLVYTSMLMHALLVANWVYSLRKPMYILPYHMMYLAFGHLIVCMLVGLFFSLLWDYPLAMGVEHVIMYRTQTQWLRAGTHPNLSKWKLKNDPDNYSDSSRSSDGKKISPAQHQDHGQPSKPNAVGVEENNYTKPKAVEVDEHDKVKPNNVETPKTSKTTHVNQAYESASDHKDDDEDDVDMHM